MGSSVGAARRAHARGLGPRSLGSGGGEAAQRRLLKWQRPHGRSRRTGSMACDVAPAAISKGDVHGREASGCSGRPQEGDRRSRTVMAGTGGEAGEVRPLLTCQAPSRGGMDPSPLPAAEGLGRPIGLWRREDRRFPSRPRGAACDCCGVVQKMTASSLLPLLHDDAEPVTQSVLARTVDPAASAKRPSENTTAHVRGLCLPGEGSGAPLGALRPGRTVGHGYDLRRRHRDLRRIRNARRVAE